MLVNTLLHTGQPPQQRMIQFQMSVMSRLRNSGLNEPSTAGNDSHKDNKPCSLLILLALCLSVTGTLYLRSLLTSFCIYPLFLPSSENELLLSKVNSPPSLESHLGLNSAAQDWLSTMSEFQLISYLTFILFPLGPCRHFRATIHSWLWSRTSHIQLPDLSH